MQEIVVPDLVDSQHLVSEVLASMYGKHCWSGCWRDQNLSLLAFQVVTILVTVGTMSRPPPLPSAVKNVLNFIQFLGKFCKIVGRRLLLWGILGPPLQWMHTVIQDYSEVGAPILLGWETCDFAKISQKLLEIEIIWTPEGSHPKFHYVDPPLA